MDETTSALIGRIYEGAHDPNLFAQGIADILPLAGAQVGLIVATGVSPGPAVGVQLLGTPRASAEAAIATYEVEGLWRYDPTVHHFTANPRARFFDTALHRDRDLHLSDRYTAWNRHHIAGTHWMACHVTRADDHAFGVALHRLDSGTSFDPAARTIFRQLFEHLERAQRLATRPPDLSRTARAMLVIDGRRRVCGASPAADAILAAADGLDVRDAALVTSDPRQQRRLDTLIDSALAAVARGGVGGAMPIERPSGRRSLALLVDPLPDQSALGSFMRGALVRLVDPEGATAAAAADRWRMLWNLTAAETRAALALVEHEFNLRAAAGAIGITYATIRTQLAALFVKTRTRSQPELMRLLTRVPD